MFTPIYNILRTYKRLFSCINPSLVPAIMMLFGMFTTGLSYAQSLVTLQNKQWQVVIDPGTLMIKATPYHGHASASLLNRGKTEHTVTRLSQSDTQKASWAWKAQGITINAQLKQKDLFLSFNASKPQSFIWLHQPTDKLRKGMIWPLGDGTYVPSHSELFSHYLSSTYMSPSDTTQDLSLPLWELDYGDYSYSWILLNPWNNRINFNQEGNQLQVNAEHTFTPLNLKQPFTVLLHLSTTSDKLAGAKRYRQWLKDNNLFVSMKDKLKAVPEGKKLLGAPQIYLWGGELLSPSNITDWKGLIDALQHPERSGLSSLVAFMDKGTLKTIKATSPERPYAYEKYTIMDGINSAIAAMIPYNENAGSSNYISQMQTAILQQRTKLYSLLKPFVVPVQQWGDGLSTSVINKLHQAGFTHLWLGFTNWRGAMAHTKAIKLAKKYGYIIATYDSYNTALAPSNHRDWLTAHMGTQVYKDCFIKTQDKTILKGFKQRGRRVSPACAMPYFKKRTSDLQNVFHLNGWFLDADATGAVYENYNPDYKSTQSADAAERAERLRYLGKKYSIVVGSEQGNAVEAANIFFGQGVDAPVFAWGNKEMFYNRHSKYYRGGYWPTSQPTLFFKAIPLQKEFAEVIFAPQYRVPLFQAVFHDSEITTFHWYNGLFKYKGIAGEREINQMLYAQPPLYHLNAATADQRIKQIRYADKFFQPVGERLATKALTQFKWLNNAKTLQETVFSDGTRLIANFDNSIHSIDGHTLQSLSLLEIMPNGQTRYFKSHLS